MRTFVGSSVTSISTGPLRCCVRLCQRSDVDLALSGELTQLQAEAIAGELEDLPLPYHFDVCALKHIRHQPLQEHIGRVGICIYSAA